VSIILDKLKEFGECSDKVLPITLDEFVEEIKDLEEKLNTALMAMEKVSEGQLEYGEIYEVIDGALSKIKKTSEVV
jgi:hypothetical protein